MNRTYTSASAGLRAALARNAAAKESAKPAAKAKPHPVAPAQEPSAAWSPAIAASPAARAVTQRAIAMIDSPHFEAHRDLAMKLFQNPKLSGAEIRALLAVAGSKTDAEADAALADMTAALADAAENNPASASTTGTGTSRAANIWAKAYERTFGEAGE